MSPLCFGGWAYVFTVNGSDFPGYLGNAYVNNAGGVIRPVISLKKEVIVTSGDGSGNSPYGITMQS